MSGETPEIEKLCDLDVYPPTNSLHCNESDGSIVRTINGTLLGTPVHLMAHLIPMEMGLTPTLTSHGIKNIDKALVEDGYDNDCQLGPLVETGVEAEELVCMDKEALGSEISKILQNN